MKKSAVFAERFKGALLLMRGKARELAAKCSIDEARISQLKSGELPSVAALHEIYDAPDLEPDELLPTVAEFRKG